MEEGNSFFMLIINGDRSALKESGYKTYPFASRNVTFCRAKRYLSGGKR